MSMLDTLTTRITKSAKIVSWVCCLIASVTAVCLILLTVCDVFARFVFSKPINGSFELTEYLLVIMVFMAIPWATFREVHVRVDLFSGKLKEKRQAILYGIFCILSMFITFLFGWYTFPEVKYSYELQFRSDMLDIPSYPFYFIIMIGFFIICFTLLAVLIKYINKVADK